MFYTETYQVRHEYTNSRSSAAYSHQLSIAHKCFKISMKLAMIHAKLKKKKLIPHPKVSDVPFRHCFT